MPSSLACEATIRVKQCKQTVCEHGNNLGVCSAPSYEPVQEYTVYFNNLFICMDFKVVLQILIFIKILKYRY